MPADRRRTSAARESVILANLPLVRRATARFSDRGASCDDLMQVGTIGLIHAVDRFDAHRGVPFGAYATPTIVGEIRRYFRDDLRLVRGPRPTGDQAGASRPATVFVTLLGDRDTFVDFSVPDRMLGRVEDCEALRRHVATMPPRDRLLLFLRFFEDQTLAQIARRVGVSQSRVSRLLNQALDRLREQMTEPGATANSTVGAVPASHGRVA